MSSAKSLISPPCVDISSPRQRFIRRTLRQLDTVEHACGHIFSPDIPEGAYDTVFIHFAQPGFDGAVCVPRHSCRTTNGR